MDLGAYANINELSEIAKANNIEVSRFRGYRLMKDEEPVTEDMIKDMSNTILVDWFRSYLGREYIPGIGVCYSFNNKKAKKYFKMIDKIEYLDWSKIHGKMRKNLKFAKKFITKETRDQWNMWNKYCGKNVLYIHAKQGRSNWSDTTYLDYMDKDWYLDGCNDSYDSCYCDIYAKIED